MSEQKKPSPLGDLGWFGSIMVIPDWEPYTQAHDIAIYDHGYEVGRAWLDGEEIPTADEMLRDYEAVNHVDLPSRDGADLTRIRKRVRQGFRDGKNDVAN